MNKFLMGVGVLSLSVAMARSSVDRQLDNCSGDLTCVSKVLAELIESGQSGGGNGGASGGIVEFYYDDGKCQLDNLLKRVNFGISTAGCERAAQTVTKNVWGVKIDGVCSDISDTNFLNACNRYAAVEKSAALKQIARDAE